MDELGLGPAVQEYAGDIREALGFDLCWDEPPEFDRADDMLQALLIVASELNLAMLGVRPDQVSIMRMLARTYSKSNELALSVLERHRRQRGGYEDR